MDNEGRGRKRASLVIALSAHAGLLLLGSRMSHPAFSPPVPPVETSEREVIEVTELEPGKLAEPTHEIATVGSVVVSTTTRALSRGSARRPSMGAPEAHLEAPESPPVDAYDVPEGTVPTGPWSPALGLSLDREIAVAPPTAPAPTSTPKAPPVTGGDTERAIEAAIRSKDADLGLGNPEENAVAVAVQTEGRATPVASGARARFAIDIDSAGSVTSVTLLRTSQGGVDTWAETLQRIRADLEKKPVQLGPDAKRKGVRVVVDATVLHVFASGSDKYVTAGPCPSMHLIGGETTLSLKGPSADAAPFGAVGGTAFGEPATGTCALGDIQSMHKQIVVRTRTSVVFPGEKQAPPPLDSFPRPPRPRPLSIWRLLFDHH